METSNSRPTNPSTRLIADPSKRRDGPAAQRGVNRTAGPRAPNARSRLPRAGRGELQTAGGAGLPGGKLPMTRSGRRRGLEHRDRPARGLIREKWPRADSHRVGLVFAAGVLPEENGWTFRAAPWQGPLEKRRISGPLPIGTRPMDPHPRIQT